jgi:DNA-binding transcriptional ArsR family regulator
MNAFIELRKHARDKRDKALAAARKDYATTLVRIAALEQDILGRELSTHKTISGCINRVLPTDRAFTTVDVMTALEALDPGRAWRKRAIDNHISRLRDRGVVTRLRKSNGTEPAIYARNGVEVAPLPFQGKTLLEVAGEVLGDRSLTLTELVVDVLEAGYVTKMTPKVLRSSMGAMLRKESGRFRVEGGSWVVIQR